MAGRTYTILELQGIVGIQARTLRHWIRRKLLPKPLGKGRSARYTELHLLRAKAVLHLRSQRVGLEVIRYKLARLTEEQVAALLPQTPEGDLPPEGAPSPPPAPTYPAIPFEVLVLLDGLVLMVDSRKGPALRRIADEIYRYYGGPAAARQGG